MQTAEPSEHLTADQVGLRIVDNVAACVLGKRPVVRMAVAAMLARGHVLLEDQPGVGKTLLARSLAASIGGQLGRIQGAIDLLPSDLTGGEVHDARTGEWVFRAGPIANHVVLFDELNRSSPRTHAPLLEAMQEGTITVDGRSRALPRPFFVVATQNPFDTEGTFPLAPGQLDRFAVRLSLGLPDRSVERELIVDQAAGDRHAVFSVCTPDDVEAARRSIASLHVAPEVADYALAVVDDLRHRAAGRAWISTRAARTMVDVARAHAALDGRDFVAPDDLKVVAPPVLAHRLAGFESGGHQWAFVEEGLASVPTPR